MTQTKLELATKLARLRNKGEDPSELAKVMTLMKLCAAIDKLEEDEEPRPPGVGQKIKQVIKKVFDDSSDEE